MESTLCTYKIPERSARRKSRAPMRIALFTGAYNHIADGVSLTLNRLVAYLERTGAEVLVLAPTVAQPPVRHAGTLVPVPSIAAPGRPEYRVSLGLPASVRERLAAFDPTLFHIATPDVLGFKALRLAERWNVPVVASYHTHFSSYLKYYGFGAAEPLLWKYLRYFYGKCRHIYVPSPSMADVLRSNGIAHGLHLWQRGVETSRFNPGRRSLAWRRSLGLSDDEVVVSFIGRLVWEKGLHLFAEVVEGLEARGIPHRSLIVGDGPARAELQARLVTDRPLRERMGRAALAHAQTFEWDAVLSRLAGYYADLLRPAGFSGDGFAGDGFSAEPALEGATLTPVPA